MLRPRPWASRGAGLGGRKEGTLLAHCNPRLLGGVKARVVGLPRPKRGLLSGRWV